MFLEEVWTSSGALASSFLSFYMDAAQSCSFGYSALIGHMASGLINRSNKIYFRTQALSRCVGRTLVGNTVKHKRVLFYSDNESVVHVINKQTSKHIGLPAVPEYIF